MGDVIAEGAAGGGPAARVELIDVFATVASFTLGGEGGNPLSMEVGEANIFCWGAFAEAVAVAAVALKVGGSDIVLVTRADLCGSPLVLATAVLLWLFSGDSEVFVRGSRVIMKLLQRHRSGSVLAINMLVRHLLCDAIVSSLRSVGIQAWTCSSRP